MKNQRGFIPLIIILVVLLGIGGAYYLGTIKPKSIVIVPTPAVSSSPSSVATFKSATPDPTSSWKTYTNTKCKYSLKYPPTWNLYPENEEAIFGVASITSYSDNDIPKSPNLLKIQIGCGELSDNQSPNEWMENRKTLDDGYSVPEFDLLSGGKVDNKLTFKYRVNPSIGDDVLNYFVFPNEDRVVSLAFTPFESTLSSYVDQILSTFRFTN